MCENFPLLGTRSSRSTSAGPGAAPTPEARSGGGMRDMRTRSRCAEPRREHPGRDAGPPRPPSAETAPRQGQRGAGPGAEPPPRTLIPGARQPRLPRGRWSVSPAPAVRDRMPHGGSNNRASASQSPGARGLRPRAGPSAPPSELAPPHVLTGARPLGASCVHVFFSS